ncbi:MAG: hypothetical protein JSV31_09515 [Desulfobacterales bacterium]|nr:MAG: hypothetical protein JSV31_09515 [Desulfobacterales bacterium]
MPKKTLYFRNRNLEILIAVILVFFTIAVLTGCTSAKKYGGLKGSREITDIFEKNQILADHFYYYNGFQSIPYVIVGINNEYMLRSSVWREIKLTPTLLNQLTTRMRSVYTPSPRGAWILGPDEERLGIWYSTEQWTAVRLDQDNRIIIAPPQPLELR